MIGNERDTVYLEPIGAPLIRFRAWRLGTDGLLHGWLGPSRWRPGVEREARCCKLAEHEHVGGDCTEVPLRGCSCGLYAFEHLHDLIRAYPTARRVVYGLIQLRGKVIVHETGYRGQYARIHRLFSMGEQESALDEIAARYHVALEPIDWGFDRSEKSDATKVERTCIEDTDLEHQP